MSDFAQEEVTPEVQSPIPLIYESLDSSKNPKDNIVEILDQIELHVERIRKEAVILEEEKDTLFTTLDTLRHSHIMNDLAENDKDDVERYLDRISARCGTIDICVRTSRDQAQEEALYQVNKLIDNLVKDLQSDLDTTKMRCRAFMASCSSHSDGYGAEDKNFEIAILGCTVDDQKRIKRRLEGLMSYIEKLSVVS